MRHIDKFLTEEIYATPAEIKRWLQKETRNNTTKTKVVEHILKNNGRYGMVATIVYKKKGRESTESVWTLNHE